MKYDFWNQVQRGKKWEPWPGWRKDATVKIKSDAAASCSSRVCHVWVDSLLQKMIELQTHHVGTTTKNHYFFLWFSFHWQWLSDKEAASASHAPVWQRWWSWTQPSNSFKSINIPWPCTHTDGGAAQHGLSSANIYKASYCYLYKVDVS